VLRGADEDAALEGRGDGVGDEDLRPGRVLSRRLQGGDQAEEDRGQRSGAEAEEQHGDVQADHGFSRDEPPRDRPHEGLEAEVREEAAEAGPEEREQEALDQELAHQPGAARPERRPHRHLALPGGRPREQHVRHVAGA
jgi:hypothetical protein